MAKKKQTKPLLLIDADVLVFQASACVEKVICFDDDNCFPVGSLVEAMNSFEYRLKFICEKLDTDDFILCFSGEAGRNFRRGIEPLYKANRSGKARPMTLKFLIEQVKKDYADKVLSYPNLEADDVMGIYATDPNFMPDRQKIIVTIDKDLKGVPCYFFNIGKPDEGVLEVNEEEADYWWFIQALKGDPTDGYAGCPTYGDKTAEKALADVPRTKADLWAKVVECYDKKGLSEAVALVQANLARILRHGDYNFETMEVTLWT